MTHSLIANQPKMSLHASVTASTQLCLPNVPISRFGSLTEDGILVVVYNLENALLSVGKELNLNPSFYIDDDDDGTDEEEEMNQVKSLTFAQASQAFGGRDGISLLKVHFDSLIAMDVKLFVMSRKSSQIVTIVLERCGLLKYFQNDRVLGKDRNYFGQRQIINIH